MARKSKGLKPWQKGALILGGILLAKKMGGPTNPNPPKPPNQQLAQQQNNGGPGSIFNAGANLATSIINLIGQNKGSGSNSGALQNFSTSSTTSYHQDYMNMPDGIGCTTCGGTCGNVN